MPYCQAHHMLVRVRPGRFGRSFSDPAHAILAPATRHLGKVSERATLIIRYRHGRRQPWRIWRARLAVRAYALKHREAFSHVKTFCLFLGYPRSGHSLIGSLLDAHPQMVIAHEARALRFIQHGFGRQELYSLIIHNSSSMAARSNSQSSSRGIRAGARSGYSYEVPGQWQGRFRELCVLGDKSGGQAVHALQSRPDLLSELARVVRDPVKFIQVVRNPFDTISTIAKRNGGTLSEAADFYFSLSDTIAETLSELDDHAVLRVRHESLIADPGAVLREICAHLGVDAPDDYIRDCSSIVFASPHRSRHEAPWTDDLKDQVHHRMERFPFLDSYSWDD